jgi:CubicO group peptidase (beta-lactamase class C family)
MSYKDRLTCRRSSLFVTSLLFCLSLAAQPSFEAVDQLLKQNQKTLGNFVALAWKDGKIVYQKQASPDFTAKTAAPIGAAGNWMTAALVMTFVDEGKLSLDDKVTQFIPLFGKYMKGYITIRNCLTNTTGVKGEEGGKVQLKSKFESLEEEVNSYATKHDIGTNPGTEFLYSGIGPNIVARVLEIVGKKPFDRLMMDRIIRPCKMKATSFSSEDGGAINASGGARSTANDYINFLVMLLNKGTFEGKKVLSEKAVEEMQTAQFASLPVRYTPKSLQNTHYGLGAFIIGTNAAGAAAVMAAPNEYGVAPFLDKCRGYATILIVEKPEEEKKPLLQSLVNLIGEQMGACAN